MPLDCRKASVRASAAQWNLDALVACDGDVLPCFFSVVPTYGTFQTVSGDAGEKLIGALAAELGAPSSAPQVVKGGSCGGEEEDAEFAFTGAMVSVTWEFPKEERAAFLARVKGLLGRCEGLS
ncbi:MAG: hypothetical protein ACM31I_10045 [Deltaproteobacteria bacterium]